MSFDQYMFTKPTFLRGVARAIDLRGVISREAVVVSATTADADRRGLRSDWRVTLRDFAEAGKALNLDGEAL